jgi:dipeptidyl-peptidase III
MPWNPIYRKPSVTGIIANAIDVVVETGDSGPVTPVGINLPNDQRIREQYGSKSVSLANVNEAYDKSTPPAMRSEFAWSPDETDRAEKFGTLGGELHTDLHEVLGHASGRQKEGLKGTPQELIKEHFSALEEARADLVALYFCQIRRWSSWESSRPPIRRRSCVLSTRPTPATPSFSCGACARGRSSRKTICGTGKWWCVG